MDLQRVFTSILLSSLAGCGGAVVVVGDGGEEDSGADAVTLPPVPPMPQKCTSIVPATKTPCGYSVKLQGDCSALPTTGNIPAATCRELCGGTETYCWRSRGDYLQCGLGCEGRRPPGLSPRERREESAVGEWLARAAFLERASVDAFEILRAELARLGAPAELLEAASAAAEDEVRHARVMRSLARAAGAAVEEPRVERGEARALEAIAIENAVEGCVRETYGALQNAWQAERAEDPRVRAAMRAISREELSHATLAWKVAAFLEPKLEPAARERVREAREHAVRELEAAIASEPDPALVRACGIPDARAAQRLASGLKRALWS